MPVLPLKIPRMLKDGDTIAVVSPSWGGPFDEPEKYERGKKALSKFFNVTVVDMPNTKRSPQYLKQNPQARADDLIEAFEDKNINGIIASIGGFDSIRLLEHIDLSTLSDNPKAFIGFSDTTCVHFMCRKAGISSFYGPSVLGNFAEYPVQSYTGTQMRAILFENNFDHIVPEWGIANETRRTLQGHTRVSGTLIGGCIQTFPMMENTSIWPDVNAFDNAVLFIETVPSITPPDVFKAYLRDLGMKGLYNRLNGILLGRIGDASGLHPGASGYHEVLRDVVGREFSRPDMPVFVNVEFGHTRQITIMPYGANVEMDSTTTAITFKAPIVQP